MARMEIEIISTESIKPCSPTPDHLRTFKLSLLDQFAAPVFSKLVLFYLPSSSSSSSDAAANGGDKEAETLAKSRRLKTSLSEILPLFYPFAGRINGNFAVDCNDDGAVFVEARVRRELGEVLKEPSDEVVRQFLPLHPKFTEAESGRPLLVIQTSFFDCGGVAVGLLYSHKMADAAAMATFVTAWSAAARGSGDAVEHPELLTGASLFPPKDFLANLQIPSGSKESIITKRFVFPASGVGALKSKSVSGKTGIQSPPTRVESVSALIWKCATKAARSNSQNKKKASVLFQSVNLRKRFNPPLPENSTGNIVGYYPVETPEEDDEIDLHGAVDGLKVGLIELCNGYVKKLQEKAEGGSCGAILERMKVFDRGDAVTYTVTSWCRFPIKDADFGWGKPAWVATAYLPFKNIVVLMDTSDDGGFEAWVSLKVEDMGAFERDEELLEYASPNPPVDSIGKPKE